MADLVERLMNAHPARPGLPVEAFLAVLGEWATGGLSGTQAQAAVTALSGTPLVQSEIDEAQALVNTVTAIPVTGTAVQIADGRAQRALRVQKIERVLRVAWALGNPDEVRTRLGITP